VNHWIIAPVILPAILAPIIVLAMRNDVVLQRVFSVAGTVALAAISAGLLWQASHNPPEVYLMGNWPAPFGIVLVLDRLSALLVALTAVLAIVVLLYVIGTGWDRRGRHFHALFHFQLMGICGAFLTGDAFNLFVFFEVLLIASYGLMIHGGGKDRLRAGVQYIAYNLAGSTLFLFALGTLYSVTGTLNMADMAERIAALPEGDVALARVGGTLLILVFAVKGALVPLQFWLPNTYAHAPGPVSALFAIMTKVGAYAILRVYTLIFPPETTTGTFFADLLMPAALVTLAVGMIGVLGATTLARLAAFGAIGSMGTLFLAIVGFSEATAAVALYYLIHSTLAGAMIFLVADMVLERRGSDTLRAVRPPMSQHGLLASLYFVAAIALAGMPPLSGFLGKLLVLDALSGRPDTVIIWSMILATSLVAIVGLARAGSVVFWKAHAVAEAEPEPDQPVQMLSFASVIALAGLIVAITVFAGPLTGWLEGAAAELHDRAAYIGAHDLPVAVEE